MDQTNLIVNYLPPSLTQDEFTSLFESIGPVQSSRLISNKSNGQSLCYGFVNYFSPCDAERAIGQLNGLRILDKILKVSLARPNSESIRDTNLYVAGFPKQWHVDELEQLFSSCGKIIDCRILYDRDTGESKSVGFVRFDTYSEAMTAIARFNCSQSSNLLVNDYQQHHQQQLMRLTVKYANQTMTTKSRQQQVDYHHHQESSEGTMSSACSSTSLSNNTITHYMGNPSSSSVAAAAGYFQPQPPLPFLPTPLPVPYHTAAVCCGNQFTLFVFNLQPTIDEQQLYELFAQYGAICEIRIVLDRQTQKPKGYAFVTMLDYVEASAAVHALNGALFQHKSLQVSFKK